MRKHMYVAQCEDCQTSPQDFATQLQRERWVRKAHIGHTIWTWRKELTHAA